MKSLADIKENVIGEKFAGNHPADPPVMLLLRRKAIRLFNNGERVALYHNEKLGIEISIPYAAGHFSKQVPMAVREEEELQEGAIHKLHHIAKTKQAGDVMFKNGATSRVDPATAHKVVALHSKLDAKNKQTVEKLVNDSPAGLTKVAGFALSNLKL